MKEIGTITEFDGPVTELAGGDFYRVVLDNGHKVLARKNGPMAKNRITVTEGDRVRVELSAYDLTRGRVTSRYC